MKRLVILPILLSIILIAAGCNRTVVVHAQTLPVNRTLVWDANPPEDNVTNYTVRLDGTIVGNPTIPSQTITFTTAGKHILTVTATNEWGTSGPATLNVNVVIPNNPNNLRLQP